MLLAALTALTLVAFAANSLLCRLALGDGLMDPVSFTAIRLLGGALVLVPLARRGMNGAAAGEPGRAWRSGAALFCYALGFSLAYVWLDAGVGALILFGAVQVTMIAAGVAAGERPRPIQWLGLAGALGGLVLLVAPGWAAPDPLGALMMLAAGVAWGAYSLLGRGVAAPVAATAAAFVRATPLGVAALAVSWPWWHLELPGVVLAVASGAITSGLGYVLWTWTLRRLTTTQAAVVQLLVPVLTAAGGVALLSEVVTVRQAVASLVILGGVGMGVLGGSSRAGATPRRRRDP